MADDVHGSDPLPLRDLLSWDQRLDDDAFRARFGDVFLLVTAALVETPFDLDGTLPEHESPVFAGGPSPVVEPTVYFVRRRVDGQGPLTIGRTKATDVVLPDRTVSKLQAFLTPRADGALVVTDAGSKNGTWHDGARLADGASVVVQPGQAITFGTVAAKLLDLRRLRVALGAHPDRAVSFRRARVEQPVSPDSGAHVFASVVDVLTRLDRGGPVVRQDLDRTDVDRLSAGSATEDDDSYP